MIIESNRLNQKIKRLKEELAREKELKKEAERQLKMMKESVATSSTVGKSQVLEITKPSNIGLIIGVPISDDFSKTESRIVSAQPRQMETVKNGGCQEEMFNFLTNFAKMIEEQRTSEIEAYYKDFLPKFRSSLDLNEIKRHVEPKNRLFQMLCEELFHRRSRTANGDQDESWRNYQELFSALPSHVFLPDIWIFDIIKEFVYWFQIESTSSITQGVWNKNSVIEALDSLFSNQSSFKLQCFSFIGLLQLHIFFENPPAILELLNSFKADSIKLRDLSPEVSTNVNYEIGFAYLVAGRCLDAATHFVVVLKWLKNTSLDEENYTQKAQRCLAFCVANNAKVQKTIPKSIVTTIETTYKLDIEEWKDGKIEAFWSFFSECSPYICRQARSTEWKTQNLRSIKYCLQRVTTWKPLRNLKGLLRICEILPLESVPKSIMPVTTESDIMFFCDNNNGLLRLVNSKSSGIEKVLRDFPNIHKKETLTLLIMQYHKILRKQRSDEKVLAFGRKFVSVLKAIGYSGKINVEDAMCYIREVSKISMEAANKLVEDHCKS